MLVVQKKPLKNAQNKWNKTTPHEIKHIAPKNGPSQKETIAFQTI